MNFIKKNGWGILLCVGIALPAWYLGKLLPVVGGPVFAILLGMILTLFIKDKGVMQAGIAYTSKKILQYAVVLLGFGMNLSTVLATGQQSLPIILTTITAALVMFCIRRSKCLLRFPRSSASAPVSAVVAPLRRPRLSLGRKTRKLRSRFPLSFYSIFSQR